MMKQIEVMKELFDSLKYRYQINLESIEGGELVFDYVQFLYCKYHKNSKLWWII